MYGSKAESPFRCGSAAGCMAPKPRVHFAAALPPDVRRGSAPPLVGKTVRAMPLVRPLAHRSGAEPEPGAQPDVNKFSQRRGGAPPHIRRQSRSAASRTERLLSNLRRGKVSRVVNLQHAHEAVVAQLKSRDCAV